MASLSVLSSGRLAAVPAEHRRNFRHLYLDIFWFGVLNGSAISFLAVYAARLGATGFQLGLISALPGLVAVLFTLPAGQWLRGRPVSRPVFVASVLHRAAYVPFIFLPVLLAPQQQVWVLILFVLLMSVPGTLLAVGFSVLFGAAVPEEWRGEVVGKRNALLAASFIVTSLLCGVILERLPFPMGYQLVFALGAFGALMSSLHLWFVRPLSDQLPAKPAKRTIGDLARPGLIRVSSQGFWLPTGLRYLARPWTKGVAVRQLWREPFARVMLLLFFFHLVQYLAIPLFPLYWVNQLGFSDATISLGNALFYVAVLAGSTQLARFTLRFGNHHLLAAGIVLMSSYPLLTAMTRGPALFFVTAIVGGLAWSQVGGALGNYLLERVPDENRAPYLAWYNLALNLAVLTGSLGGPFLADSLGLVPVLLIATAGRLGAALLLWRKG